MAQAHLKKILILGCSTKAGAYVAKQFSKAGYEIIIYDWMDLPNKRSRYVSRYINVASPETDLFSFEKKFLEFLTTNPVYAIVPLHDAALEIIRHLRPQLPSGIKTLGLNENPIYKYAHNKWELLKLAKGNGIQVPQTIYMSALDEIGQALPFTFPCVVKPVSSALVKDGRLYTFGVSVVKNTQELQDRVREVILNVPVMVQEFIEGYGIGFNFLAKDGELLNSYIHRRITEHGGVSSYRELLRDTAYGNRGTVASFIKKISWTGAGMLEFKVQNGVPVLMELNGRFFGSIELSVKSGLNLPKQFLELYLDQKPPQKNQSFHINTKVRNLHDEVILNLADLAKGKLLLFLKWKLQVWKSIFTKHDFIEDNIFTDPGFVIGLYTHDLKRIWKKFRQRSKLRSFSIPPHIWQLKHGKPLSIAFVCKGNICRSPFAELYARSVNTYHSFYSYGSYMHENRLSPLDAVSAASQFNISLQDHTSRYLSKEVIFSMDVFVVMDKSNYFDLITLGAPAEKIKFLSGQEIPDPYKKNYDYFVAVYTSIKNNIDLILKNEKIS